MQLVVDNTPYGLLRDLEIRSRNSGALLPKREDKQPTFTGIAFRLGEFILISPLGEIQEILETPVVTFVPHAKRWIRGVANVRGRLLPINDLRLYVGMAQANVATQNRLLIVNRGSITAGLIVDGVIGQRHFFDDERVPTPSLQDHPLAVYLRGRTYRKEGEYWLEIDLQKLISTSQFLQVGE